VQYVAVEQREQVLYNSEVFKSATLICRELTEGHRTMTSTSPLHPWEERQPSYGLKLLAMVGAGLLLIIALVSLFVVIIAPIGMARNSPNPQGDLTALAIGLGLLLVSGFGLYKLFPILRQPTGFKPSYGAVAPDALGHPFEVRRRFPDAG
jgi:hypothetical protein